MGRKRKKDQDLPRRWVRSNGAIFYRVPPGKEREWNNKKWFLLGHTEAEAYISWAERLGEQANILTMSDLFDRYLLEHTPTMRPKTQRHHRNAISKLRPVFGAIDVQHFESKWAFEYYDRRSKSDGISAANQDIKTLSHVFTKAIEWGVIKNSEHPTRGLSIKKQDGVKTRYVEDWEIVESLKVANDTIKYYIIFKIITGMDKNMILNIKLQDITEDGILASRKKIKGKQRLYRWSEELRDCVNKIRNIKRNVSSMYLFCNNKGQPYVKEDATTSTFDSNWKRFIKKALTETELKERFTPHDLRAKAASDAESAEIAKTLLGHSSSKITEKVYRRKPQLIDVGKVSKDILGE